MSDVEKMAEQCRAWAQQIINDGTSSQAGPDASDMLAMAATLDALSALGGWNEAIEAAADLHVKQSAAWRKISEQALDRTDSLSAVNALGSALQHEEYARAIRALRRPAAEGESRANYPADGGLKQQERNLSEVPSLHGVVEKHFHDAQPRKAPRDDE